MGDEILNESQEEAKQEQKEMEQEDKSAASEKTNPMPEPATEEKSSDSEKAPEEENGEAKQDEEETTVEKLSGKVDPLLDAAKAKGDEYFDKGLSMGRDLYDKHKDRGFKVYDAIMNFKDDVHYGKKELLKQMNTGVSAVKEKVANTKFGQWVTKKKEERAAKKAAEAEKPKEPGFFSKLWTNIKTGVSAAKNKVENSKFAGAVKSTASKARNAIVNNPVVQLAKTGVSALKSKVADSKAGKWIAAKMEERAAKKAAEAGKPKEPGFFSKTWDKVKTGVSAVKDSVVNSKFGKRVSKEVSKGKEWVDVQKKWLNEKKKRLEMEKNKFLDEVDDREHERRMAYESRRDPEYRKHYEALVEELKQNPGIKDLQGSISRGELDSFMNDLESGKEEKEEETSVAQKIGGTLEDKSETISDAVSSKVGLSEKQNANVASGIAAVGNVIKAGDSLKDTIQASKKKGAIEDLANTDEMKDDELLQKGAKYAIANYEKKTVNSALETAQSAVSAVGNIADIVPGGSLVSTVASAVNMGLQGAQKIANAKMDKTTRKMGMKGIIGGVAGYKALKSKYNLKAPEMRRAMREVLGMRTDDDVVNADRGKTSVDISSRAQNGDKNAQNLLNTMGAKTQDEAFTNMGGSEINRRTYGKTAFS
jgi:hypothetical protein